MKMVPVIGTLWRRSPHSNDWGLPKGAVVLIVYVGDSNRMASDSANVISGKVPDHTYLVIDVLTPDGIRDWWGGINSFYINWEAVM